MRHTLTDDLSILVPSAQNITDFTNFAGEKISYGWGVTYNFTAPHIANAYNITSTNAVDAYNSETGVWLREGASRLMFQALVAGLKLIVAIGDTVSNLYHSNGVQSAISSCISMANNARIAFDAIVARGNSLFASAKTAAQGLKMDVKIPQTEAELLTTAKNAGETALEYSKNNWVAVTAGVAASVYFTKNLTSLWAMNRAMNDARSNNNLREPSLFALSNLTTTTFAMGMQVAAVSTTAMATFAPVMEVAPEVAVLTCAAALVSYSLAASSLRCETRDLSDCANNTFRAGQDLGTARIANAGLQKQLRDANASNAGLQMRLGSARTEIVDGKAASAELQASNSDLKARLANTNSENSGLRRDNRYLRAETSSVARAAYAVGQRADTLATEVSELHGTLQDERTNAEENSLAFERMLGISSVRNEALAARNEMLEQALHQARAGGGRASGVLMLDSPQQPAAAAAMPGASSNDAPRVVILDAVHNNTSVPRGVDGMYEKLHRSYLARLENQQRAAAGQPLMIQ